MSHHALADAAHYLRQIVNYRYFWVHLAMSDLRARFRRSHLGMLWIMLQPTLFTLILAMVFKFVFKQPFEDYSVYVFSGLLLWDFITVGITQGAACFLSAEGYIKQVRLPMLIYPLKTLLYCSIVFLMAFTGFALYVLAVKPSAFGWTWLFTPVSFVALALFSLPLTVLSGIINMKFRDFQQFIGLILQMVWYLSPVMMPREVYDHPGLREWTAINPIAALMDLFRNPLLHHLPPDAKQFALVLIWSLGLWALAILGLARNERRIVFYF